MPEVNWQVGQVTFSEGEVEDVCFSIGITAQTYLVEIGVRNLTAGIPDI